MSLGAMGGQTMPIMASGMGPGPGMGQVNNFSQGLGQPPPNSPTQYQGPPIYNQPMAGLPIQGGVVGGPLGRPIYGAQTQPQPGQGIAGTAPTTPKPTLPAFAHPTVYQPGPNQLPQLPATQAPVSGGYTGGGINYGAVPTGFGNVGYQPPAATQAQLNIGKYNDPLYQPGQTQANRVPNQLIRGTSAVPGQANFAPIHR